MAHSGEQRREPHCSSRMRGRSRRKPLRSPWKNVVFSACLLGAPNFRVGRLSRLAMNGLEE
jgi:hypothetical protein